LLAVIGVSELLALAPEGGEQRVLIQRQGEQRAPIVEGLAAGARSGVDRCRDREQSPVAGVHAHGDDEHDFGAVPSRRVEHRTRRERLDPAQGPQGVGLVARCVEGAGNAHRPAVAVGVAPQAEAGGSRAGGPQPLELAWVLLGAAEQIHADLELVAQSVLEHVVRRKPVAGLRLRQRGGDDEDQVVEAREAVRRQAGIRVDDVVGVRLGRRRDPDGALVPGRTAVQLDDRGRQ